MDTLANRCNPNAKPFCCPLPHCKFSSKYLQNLDRHIKRFHYDYFHYNIASKKKKARGGKYRRVIFINKILIYQRQQLEIIVNFSKLWVTTTIFQLPTQVCICWWGHLMSLKDWRWRWNRKRKRARINWRRNWS